MKHAKWGCCFAHFLPFFIEMLSIKIIVLAYSTYVKYQKFLFSHKIPPGLSDFQLLFNLRDFLDIKIRISLVVGCD